MQHTNLPTFVIGIQNCQAIMPLSYANAILGSKENLYFRIWFEGIYLRKLESAWIKTDCLLWVANDYSNAKLTDNSDTIWFHIILILSIDQETHLIEKLNWNFI